MLFYGLIYFYGFSDKGDIGQEIMISYASRCIWVVDNQYQTSDVSMDIVYGELGEFAIGIAGISRGDVTSIHPIGDDLYLCEHNIFFGR